ncbi:Ger(x)C family spore germination protein [Clostridium bovifaecis]|uniref:Ger(X)C family spore germination protein n=1 Tax=Clostridium bovifaecis TaxID=2184719 RepID=A0A6I6ETF0_9CLOT|nr:Ger(x)C family spore germination protein [Clostridium bovifaecis]
MRQINKIISLFLILSLCLTTSGCWSYKELNALEIVAGFAIDKNENDEYIMTAEFAMPTQEGMSNTPYVLSAKGKTLLDAARNIILKKGSRAYWNHAKIIIVSEAIAQEGITPVIDLILREEQLREDIYLIVSREKTAREIFYRKIEKTQGEKRVLSFDIDEGFRNGTLVAKFPVEYLYVFAEEMQKEGISSMLPVVRMQEEEGSVHATLGGAGVFKGDKLIGYLNEEETKSIIYLKEKRIFPPVSVELSKSAALENGNKTKVALRTLKLRSKIKPIFENEKVVMKIDVSFDMEVDEMEKSEVDYLSKEGRALLEEAAEEKVKKDIEKVIDKACKEFNVDVLGFGLKIKQRYPDKWKEIKERWTETLKDLETDINVDVQIRGSGLYSKPIKAKE